MPDKFTKDSLNTFDLNDKKIVVALVRKELAASKHASLLPLLADSAGSLEQRFEWLANYLVEESIRDQAIYSIIDKAVKFTQSTHTATLATLGPWHLDELMAFSDDVKTKIITDIVKGTAKRKAEFTGVHSMVLLTTLRNKNTSLTVKWDAFIYYCNKPSNVKRATYTKILTILTTTLETVAKELINQKRYAEAFHFIKTNNQAAHDLIKLSIIEGVFDKKYLMTINFSKKSFIKEFCKYEIVEKSLRGDLDTDTDTKLDRHASSLMTTFVIEAVGRTPLAFFSYQGREFNDKAKITTMLQHLSQLSGLLSREAKQEFMQDIAKKYKTLFKIKSSSISSQLVDSLETCEPVNRCWRTLVDYLVSTREGIFSNNGTRLFNLTCKAINERLEQLYNENYSSLSRS